MDTKNEVVSYLENLSLFILGVLFFTLPIALSTLTTDTYALPKQAVLGIAALLALGFFSLKMLFDANVIIKRTPFDLPIVLFTIALMLSSLFAVNRTDAIISFVLFLFAVIVYFVTVNIVKGKNALLILLTSLVGGGVIASVLSSLSFFKIYALPYSFARVETFTPLGSLLDQAIYLALLIPIGAFMTLPGSVVNKKLKSIGFGIATIIILIGFIITIYQLVYVQKPTILPFETGFQTAFAAISQDTSRTLPGFLFGSGLGTYSVDFLRFKQASFNQNAFWSLTFFRSSSFFLELLATTGILGITAFLLLLIKVMREIRGNGKNLMLISPILIFLLSFLLPFSQTIQTLLFILLALYAIHSRLNSNKKDRFFDVELQLVALRNGLLALEAPAQNRKIAFRNKILPILLNIIVFLFVLFIGYYNINYIVSDMSFQGSVGALAKNNGSLTYEKQTKAIAKFPYRDGFYRVYSQTNLALANSLASQAPKGESPDKKTQDNIVTLIQQSINAGRNATTIAPQTSLNWQNLSSIYRGLIGFGQNAESFTIASQKQAILLDPTSPQQYLTLGGIYYQLGQWDNAQNQFQIAVNLKPDFPNGYYNLGHALEQKNDIKEALAQYEIVKTLVANVDQEAYKQITNEIKALTSKESQQEKQAKYKPTTATESAKEVLEINTPSSSLPPSEPKVKIPPPINATQSANPSVF